jgi:hypothetical protein
MLVRVAAVSEEIIHPVSGEQGLSTVVADCGSILHFSVKPELNSNPLCFGGHHALTVMNMQLIIGLMLYILACPAHGLHCQ